ncbi:putative short-chain dehydrogenase reductase family protein [Phaeoacremonium minimum UCRPA7]|uniref:Putative short-chain dehydrogenase reductase family protein n=1 Tax=Phaeoacremonium minimum (strain UCR-PA7) TaxID=1286976 RepID=R8BGM0_PHAM7|nr:putative short-chain dehydrogenase reductase family protein [Phaeoacremonium minimum UCRPA7]EON98485.1 putative short-chain dehydrogenase reductase family protein [Phaeoacremonium minimum UCRPA7]
MGRLSGKNAIITGAAGGIGLETAILMSREGASVLMTDVTVTGLEKALAKVKDVVPVREGRLEALAVNVARESDVEAAVSHLDAWGGVDVMFNNAGIMHAQDGDAEECPEEIWDLTQNINVKGVWVFDSTLCVLRLSIHLFYKTGWEMTVPSDFAEKSIFQQVGLEKQSNKLRL